MMKNETSATNYLVYKDLWQSCIQYTKAVPRPILGEGEGAWGLIHYPAFSAVSSSGMGTFVHPAFSKYGMINKHSFYFSKALSPGHILLCFTKFRLSTLYLPASFNFIFSKSSSNLKWCVP